MKLLARYFLLLFTTGCTLLALALYALTTLVGPTLATVLWIIGQPFYLGAIVWAYIRATRSRHG